MDLPLEILKDVSQAIPTQQGSHALTWTPEVGYQLQVNMNGKFMTFRFDYGESISDLKEQIEMATGIPMPSKQKGEGKKEDGKATVETPILNSIGKNASLYKHPSTRARSKKQIRRPGLLTRLNKMTAGSPAGTGSGQGSGAVGAIAQRNDDMAEMRDIYGL